MAPPRHVWSLPLARVTAGATLGLIMAGGLVTTTGAGLAVPDWPTTFGENLFLFPWSRMVGGVLVEHSHRLLGVVVGCLTLGLGAAVWLEDRRDSARGLAGAAVALVAIQGLVGGLRVVLVRDVLALIHGCLAQAFFALLAALVVVTGVRGRVTTAPGSPERPGRGLAALAGLATIVVYGQIVLGAFATHEGWVLGHVGGAVVAVAGVAALTGAALGAPDPTFVRPGRFLGLLLLVQVALGLGAYLVRFTDVALPGGEPLAIALPVLHRGVSAGILGTCVAILVRVVDRGRVRSAATAAVGDEHLPPSRVPA